MLGKERNHNNVWTYPSGKWGVSKSYSALGKTSCDWLLAWGKFRPESNITSSLIRDCISFNISQRTFLAHMPGMYSITYAFSKGAHPFNQRPVGMCWAQNIMRTPGFCLVYMSDINAPGIMFPAGREVDVLQYIRLCLYRWMLGVRKRVVVRISEVLQLSLWKGVFISWLKMAGYWRGHA